MGILNKIRIGISKVCYGISWLFLGSSAFSFMSESDGFNWLYIFLFAIGTAGVFFLLGRFFANADKILSYSKKHQRKSSIFQEYDSMPVVGEWPIVDQDIYPGTESLCEVEPAVLDESQIDVVAKPLVALPTDVAPVYENSDSKRDVDFEEKSMKPRSLRVRNLLLKLLLLLTLSAIGVGTGLYLYDISTTYKELTGYGNTFTSLESDRYSTEHVQTKHYVYDGHMEHLIRDGQIEFVIPFVLLAIAIFAFACSVLKRQKSTTSYVILFLSIIVCLGSIVDLVYETNYCVKLRNESSARQHQNDNVIQRSFYGAELLQPYDTVRDRLINNLDSRTIIHQGKWHKEECQVVKNVNIGDITFDEIDFIFHKDTLYAVNLVEFLSDKDKNYERFYEKISGIIGEKYRGKLRKIPVLEMNEYWKEIWESKDNDKKDYVAIRDAHTAIILKKFSNAIIMLYSDVDKIREVLQDKKNERNELYSGF